MRTAVAIVIGIAVGVAAAGAAYVAVERPHGSQRVREAVTAEEAKPSLPPALTIVDVERRPSAFPRVVPTTPDYGPPPGAVRPIYRCGSRGATVYSDEPCAGATVVDGAGAVAGYDSRPSDRLARLVAEGRAADAGSPPAAVRSRASPVRESVECATLRQQIVDLDAATLRPIPRETLDEMRRIRQDIRTSMARSRC